MPSIKFISFFAGIAGFDLGFEHAGMECVAQVENNRYACETLERHYPNLFRLGDIKHVRANDLPSADVWCGGFPCQDVSTAGDRAGLAGERSGLWFEFIRLIREACPRTVVIENVTGLLSSNKGRDLATVVDGLVECGYRVCWRVLDAQFFGLAQRRPRVFLVGSLGDGRSAEILFEPQRGSGDSATGGREREDDTGTTTDGTGNRRQVASHDISPTITSEGWDASEDGKGRKAFVIAFDWHASLTSDRQQLVRAGDYTGALQHLKQDAVMHLGGVRRLTPTECERLQGFPDGWTAGHSDTRRGMLLGNAVPPAIAEWLGRRIVESL